MHMCTTVNARVSVNTHADTCIKIYSLALNNMKHPQTSFRSFIRNANMSSVLLVYKTKHSPYKGLALLL